MKKLFPKIIVVSLIICLASCSNAKTADAQEPTGAVQDSTQGSTQNIVQDSTQDSAQSSDKGSVAGVYTKITAEEAYEMMQNQEVIIIDVRTEAEYKEGFISNAILIPNDEITDTPPEQLPDKDAVILVYCRSGNRSAKAANKLIQMGYTKIYDFGGINRWTYGVEKP